MKTLTPGEQSVNARKTGFSQDGLVSRVEWGKLVASAAKEGRNLPVLDTLLEATAVHFGLTVVTRNDADFLNPTFNPWDS